MNTYEEIYHHGIKGQKWGVRRFQNADGSYTAAGKKRYSLSDAVSGASNYINNNKDTLKKVAKVVGTAAAIAGAAYVISNPVLRQKAVGIVKKASSSMASALGESAKRAGKAMTDSFMVGVGAIGVSKLAERLPTNTEDERQNTLNKLIYDTASAGITAATTPQKDNKNQNGSGKQVGKEVTDRIGPPSHKTIDRSGSEYQSLFKQSNGNQRDADTRATIKSLASSGYDIDQIKEYLRAVDSGSISHSVRVRYEDIYHYGIRPMTWGVLR